MKLRLTLLFLGLMLGIGMISLAVQDARASTGPGLGELKTQFWLRRLEQGDGATQRFSSDMRPEEMGMLDAQASPVGYASLMTFQSYLDGNWNIYLTNGNYEQLRRLTDHPESDVAPRLDASGDKIVFASKRYGNFDIFTMSVDGSNLRRLTTDGRDEGAPAWSPDGRQICYTKRTGKRYELYLMAADGSGQRVISYPGNDSDVDPDWSPDGKRIAFVRRNEQGYGSLMVMDADGRNVRALASGLRYLQNPRWSPDGNTIAFDYDADDDYWNELATIDVATGTIRTFADRNANLVDLWFGSWAGHEDLLVGVLVKYEVRDDQLYMKKARLFLTRSTSGWLNFYEHSWVDLSPDRRKVDDDPPESSMEPLPPVSPAYFTVRWSGEDVGIAGLSYFDVQKKEGQGDWETWKMHTTATEAKFYAGGMAGKTIFFRVRGVDRAGNVEPWPATYQTKTTIETLPPIVALDPIPEMLRKCKLISWQAEDRGGSGVTLSHFQLREVGAAEWRDMGPLNSMTRRICETPGRTYEFRVRVKDAAGNWSDWVYSHPVTLYQWKIEGRGADNRGRPLPVDTMLSPPAFKKVADPETGRYVSYAADESDAYTVSWRSPGYLPLPATAFAGKKDAVMDVVLPPMDNLVPDWGFEQDALARNWRIEGRAAIIKTVAHTGQRALRVGQPVQFIHKDIWYGYGARLALSNRGTSYLAFLGNSSDGLGSEVYFAVRSATGSWSKLKNVSHYPDDIRMLTMQLDRERDILHLAWHNGKDWRYAVRGADGVWSSSELVPPPIDDWRDSYDRSPDTALDADGNFYLLYPVHRDKFDFYLYIRNLEGSWRSEKVVEGLAGNDIAYVVEPGGAVHVVWAQEGEVGRRFFYRHRLATGQWEDPVQLPFPEFAYSQFSLVQGASGALHLFWLCNIENAEGNNLCYAERDPQGVWSEQEVFEQGDPIHWIREWQVMADDADRVHVLIFLDDALLYRQRRPDGSWSDYEAIDPLYAVPGHEPLRGFRMRVDAQHRVHFSWSRKDLNAGHGPETFYRMLSQDGQRSSMVRVGAIIYADFAVTEAGVAHLVGNNGRTGALTYAYDAMMPQDRVDAISRVVDIPADMEAPTLSLFFWNTGAPEAVVKVGDQTFSLCPDQQEQKWQHCWFDLTPWRGQNVELRLDVEQRAGTLPAWADFDEITLGSGAFPDLWITAPSLALPSHQPQTLTLAYGNASSEAVARNVVITATLPADARLISSSPPAHMDGQTLTWTFSELSPAASGEIGLTLEMNTPEVVRSLPVQIATSSHEPHQKNNRAEVTLFVDGYALRLPLFRK